MFLSDHILHITCEMKCTIVSLFIYVFILICLLFLYLSACADFWWGVEDGCSKPCQCQDGTTCDEWTGQCPDGKGMCAVCMCLLSLVCAVITILY